MKCGRCPKPFTTPSAERSDYAGAVSQTRGDLAKSVRRNAAARKRMNRRGKPSIRR